MHLHDDCMYLVAQILLPAGFEYHRPAEQHGQPMLISARKAETILEITDTATTVRLWRRMLYGDGGSIVHLRISSYHLHLRDILAGN